MNGRILTINCKKIKENIESIKGLTSNSKLLLIAKANGYGLGAEEICKHLSSELDFIGVATIEEAVSIRNSGVKTPILLLTEPGHENLKIISSYDISITVHKKETIKEIEAFSKKENVCIKTHFKIDTGMTRLGSPWKDNDNLKSWEKSSNLIIKEGIYSHFANSDNVNELNNIQLDRFINITKDHSMIKHFANSDAISNIKGCEFDLIRIGFKAYNNSFKLTAPIVHLQDVKKGTSIGYGSTYISPSDCTIGIVGIGYADGVPSQLSNVGYVSIDNVRCKIIGKICMDMFMIEYPQNLTAQINQTVTVFSDGLDNGMTITEAAKLCNVNPREIMVRFSNRIKRQYLN